MNVKHTIFRSLSIASRLATGNSPRDGLRVLMYHSVGTDLPGDRYGTSISKTSFRSHLDRYESLRQEFPSTAFEHPKSTHPAAAFSFDDGYRDTLTNAAPMLVDHNIPFIVFVAADHITAKSGPYLSKSELMELSQAPGAVIAAHGDQHTPLTELPDSQLAENLKNAKSKIEDWIGKPVSAMSYPFGAVDHRVRTAVENAGYSLAGCSLYGANTPDRDPLLLKRTEIVAWDSAHDFELKLRGHWDWFSMRQGDPAQ